MQVRELEKKLNEFSTGGELENQLATLEIEVTRTRVREKGLGRKLDVLEEQLSMAEEKFDNADELLDSKRLTVFSLQNLMRNSRHRGDQEMSNLRLEIAGRPSQEQALLWLQGLHKMKAIKGHAPNPNCNS